MKEGTVPLGHLICVVLTDVRLNIVAIGIGVDDFSTELFHGVNGTGVKHT